MQDNKQADIPGASVLIGIAVTALVLVFAWQPISNLCNPPSEAQMMQGIIEKEIGQFQMCSDYQDYTGASVHALSISAMYKQVGNVEGYRKWEDIANEVSNKAMNKRGYYYKY